MAAPPPIAPSSRPRPVFRNIQVTDLVRYRLPLPGIVSILHRISGALLFLFTGMLLWLLQTSVSDAAQFRALYSNPLVKLVVFGLLWSLLHHPQGHQGTGRTGPAARAARGARPDRGKAVGR